MRKNFKELIHPIIAPKTFFPRREVWTNKQESSDVTDNGVNLL